MHVQTDNALRKVLHQLRSLLGKKVSIRDPSPERFANRMLDLKLKKA